MGTGTVTFNWVKFSHQKQTVKPRLGLSEINWLLLSDDPKKTMEKSCETSSTFTIFSAIVGHGSCCFFM